ncbi:hypothetical protein CN498_22010 [Bacillus thuringiensis]|uniref:Uncharacterized protein n=1 Tax=Bacillus cereus (strain G9842) TaxID=405531 RepID=B7IZI7_BACC2|nr:MULTISPECIES: hypothetical protein [Bacillus cereus group]ACK98793.1 hypothetical protein BCG9842_A0114 [Bacillus cereus G9842]MCU5508173.1 hypothetical protein [Bacillus cereus]MDA2416990.1 hypothetical protein [Bacillus cereus]MDR4135831.1 hypothetical protein [Bacillus cereus]MDR4363562.1 hypothetical protein [Bacillus cereus]
MSFFFGYVDVNNDMYVIAGNSSSDTSHTFPQNQWTKAASNVKSAVISNEDYNNACDGYIDMYNNLYIWRASKTPILIDTNVKQADSSEESKLVYVKNDNTLWIVDTSGPYRRQIASNVDYAVSANNQIAYKSLDGRGYFSTYTSWGSSPNAGFVDIGAVQDVAVAGSNGGSGRYMYIDTIGTLYGSTSPTSNFSRISYGVKSVRKLGSGSIYLTVSNDLYKDTELIARNVMDYWDNITYGGTIYGIFYTTIDNPTVLKAAKFSGVPPTPPTPIKKLGSSYNDNLAYIRIEVSASDDGITFGSYAFFDPSNLPQKRFLKFRVILDGGTQMGEKKVFEFDQANPETKLALNEFVSSINTNVQVSAVYKIDGIKNDNYTDGVLFEIPVDRTKYKSIAKIEVV